MVKFGEIYFMHRRKFFNPKPQFQSLQKLMITCMFLLKPHHQLNSLEAKISFEFLSFGYVVRKLILA
jgi:hypothetical protein